LRPFNRPSHSPSDIGLPHSTLRWALVHVCTCRQIRLYGESKKSTHGHQTHLPARTHQSKTASECAHKGTKPTEAAGKAAALLLQQCARRAVTVGAGAVAPVCPLQLRCSRTLFFFPLIVPPTLVYPTARCGGLWCTVVHADKFVCMGNRKNRLTATKLISRHARTSGTSPPAYPRPPRPPATPARQVARKKARVSIL
jgi:hypothetical protein